MPPTGRGLVIRIGEGPTAADVTKRGRGLSGGSHPHDAPPARQTPRQPICSARATMSLRGRGGSRAGRCSGTAPLAESSRRGRAAGDGVVDVVDGEHDAMQASVWRGFLRLGADAAGGCNLSVQLAVAVRGRIIAMSLPDAASPTVRYAQRPSTAPCLQLHAALGEERDSRARSSTTMATLSTADVMSPT